MRSLSYLYQRILVILFLQCTFVDAIDNEEINSKYNSFSFVSTEQSELPAIPIENSINSTQFKSVQFEPWLQQELVAFGHYMNQDAADISHYIRQRYNNMGQFYINSMVRDEIQGLLKKMGQVKLRFTLNHTMQHNDYEFDYLLPFYESLHTQFFTQLGARTWQQREMLNIGLGYRYFNSYFILGTNIFYDKDLTLSHERASVGIEGATPHWRLYSNYYMPMSPWLDQNINIKKVNNIQARAAEGIDIGITGRFLFYPALSGTLEYFKWYENSIDFYGNAHQSQSVSDLNYLIHEPEGLSASLRWSPIPLFSAGISYTITAERQHDLATELALTWNLSESLAQQLVSQNVFGSLIVSNMKNAFVQRQNELVLTYRTTNDKYFITLPENIYLKENESIVLDPKVTLQNRPGFYQWMGSLASALNNLSVKTPTLTAPVWRGYSQADGTLYLSVTDVNGNVFQSNEMKIHLIESQSNVPVIQLFSDQTQQNSIVSFRVPRDESGHRIYWRLLSNRYIAPVSIVKFTWENANTLFVDNSERFPEIKAGQVSADYEPILNIEIQNEGNYKIKMPVAILKTDSKKLVWQDQAASTGLVRKTFDHNNYKGRNFTITAASNESESPTGAFSYSIAPNADRSVAKVSPKTGEVQLLSVGETTVIAMQAADENYVAATISYQLQVIESSDDFYWQSLNKASANVTYKPGLTIEIAAFTTDNSTITYQILQQSSSNVASLANSQLTIDKAGSIEVEAKRNSDNKAITYPISVNPTTVVLSWENAQLDYNHRLDIDFNKVKSFKHAATASFAQAVVKYRISVVDKDVADVSYDGTVSIKKTGSTLVYAYVEANEQFKASEIYYLVIASDGKNSGLAWHSGQILNGVLYETYVANKRCAVTAIAHLASGPIHYKIANDADHTIAKLVDNRSGIIELLKPGITKVIATQAAYNNFSEQAISYLLEVKKNKDNQLRWLSDLLTADDHMIRAIQADETLTIAAVSTHNKTPITYNPGLGFEQIISVNKNTGEIKPMPGTIGPFTVIAQQANNAYYGESSISYSGTIGLKSPLLYWIDNTFFAGSYLIKIPLSNISVSVSAKAANCFGRFKYSIDDETIVKIDETTGLISPRSPGVTRIIAYFYDSAECQDDTIVCDIEVTN